MLVNFHKTFKTPNKPVLDLPEQKSFPMASKRGYLRPKMKITKKVQFWNLIMNVTYGDYENAKIIPNFLLGEAALAQKSTIYSTVGSMDFWLTLLNGLSWGQIKDGPKSFCPGLV